MGTGRIYYIQGEGIYVHKCHETVHVCSANWQFEIDDEQVNRTVGWSVMM